MARTVKVDTALGDGAKVGLEEVAVAAGEAASKTDKLDDNLKQVEKDAGKAAATMALLGAASGDVGSKFDILGNKRTVMSDLDETIVKTQGEMRRLGDEFNRTGNINVFKDLSKTKADLKELENLRKEVSNALSSGADEGGRSFATSFMSSIQGMLSTPALGPLTFGMVAAITAVLLPAIDGAFLALGGMSGLALGVIGQLKNPAIATAAKSFADDLETTLGKATSSFGGPIISSLQMLGSALKDIIDSIDFSSLSKSLEPFIAGIAALLTNMMPGFNKLLEASGPLMQELSVDLGILGNAFSVMFAEISRSGPGAVEGLRFLFMLLAAAIETLGAVLMVSAQAFHFMLVAADDVLGALEAVFNVLKNVPIVNILATALDFVVKGLKTFTSELRDATPATATWHEGLAAAGGQAAATADDLNALNAKLGQTTVTASTLAGALISKALAGLMSLDQGVLGVAESLTRLTAAFKLNGNSIDINTAKGQANREAVLAAVQANAQLFQAQIAAGVASSDATQAYMDNTAALEHQMHQAGLTQSQIDGLIGKYRAVPGQVNTAIATQGLTDAINNLNDLLRLINGLPPRTSIEIDTVHRDIFLQQANASPTTNFHGLRWGGVYEHADIGVLRDASVYGARNPGRYMIAEPSTGGEAFIPRYGDDSRSTAILDRAARWYGGRFARGDGGGGSMSASYTINVHTLDTQAAGPLVVEAIKSYERSNGTNWRTSP